MCDGKGRGRGRERGARKREGGEICPRLHAFAFAAGGDWEGARIARGLNSLLESFDANGIRRRQIFMRMRERTITERAIIDRPGYHQVFLFLNNIDDIAEADFIRQVATQSRISGAFVFSRANFESTQNVLSLIRYNFVIEERTECRRKGTEKKVKRRKWKMIAVNGNLKS